MPLRKWLSLATAVLPAWCLAADWYVSPGGTPASAGTRTQPWDVSSALDGSHKILPGDRVLLLGGTYRRRPDAYFVVALQGEPKRPITVGPAPGADVVIDGGLRIVAPSKSVWIRDLEITVSDPDPTRRRPAEAGSFPKLDRPWGGIDGKAGEDIKLIDLTIHDCRQGIALWMECARAEVSGCIIYDNGWTGVDRGHGHAIYTQNKDGVKTIRKPAAAATRFTPTARPAHRSTTISSSTTSSIRVARRSWAARLRAGASGSSATASTASPFAWDIARCQVSTAWSRTT